MGLFFSSQSYLGVDIGISSIKVVELKGDGRKARLITYGFSENSLDQVQTSTAETANLINRICKEAGTISRSAVSALPTYSVFSSVINLFGVSKKDIAQAVYWEAKKVIPLPLEEMILDWKKVEGDNETNGKNIKVLLTGAPRALVKKYVEIFKTAKINLLSLETETFALIRSLLGNDKSTFMIADIGSNTTNITIVDQSLPLLNRSIDIGGITITKAIGNNLNIGLARAEQFKYDLGVSFMEETQGDLIPKIITETIAPIVNEMKYAINLFQSKNNKTVDKIILSGGTAMLVNLTAYLSKCLNMNVVISNPWDRVSYPLDLKPMFLEIGSRMAVATGLAMRQIE